MITLEHNIFFLVFIVILVVMVFLCLVRTMRGPKLADRIMGVNMIGTLTILIIVLLSVYLDEESILDISLIYAIMSFVAVVVVSKIYIGFYNEQKAKKAEKEQTVPAADKGDEKNDN